MDELLDHIIPRLDLPAFVRTYFITQRLTALEQHALRSAGCIPTVYARYCKKPVRVVCVFPTGDIGVSHEDDAFGNFTCCTFSELSDFSQKMHVINPCPLPDQLDVGDPVRRDDGRYYIPINRVVSVSGYPDTVMRVASDAFDSLESAEVFACIVAEAYDAER